jgi:hypothetical protein
LLGLAAKVGVARLLDLTAGDGEDRWCLSSAGYGEEEDACLARTLASSSSPVRVRARAWAMEKEEAGRVVLISHDCHVFTFLFYILVTSRGN